ncbi:hypothetical protein [Alkalibacterium kapii]|uniref:Uncharacterized protein n=1 Tax=Alkalibacterium kapii TaxID=426704 RepID=A0A511AQY2_9LACT|nr:hypothetical protein [Alkalibacterium kapii]GEK90610.1 hypothetical protein AKA01nite_02320 [Alkalibacterium kapii]
MTVKWNRESFLITLTLVAILFGLFYYGNQYFVTPVKEEADTLSVLVSNQKSVLSAYPPEETLYDEYESEYATTEIYLPVNDDSEKAMVTLEELADKAKVDILTIARLTDQETVEGVPDNFVKNSYHAEVTSKSSENLRNLIERLMKEERTWNITSFSYEKNSEADYSGNFTFELFYYTDMYE